MQHVAEMHSDATTHTDRQCRRGPLQSDHTHNLLVIPALTAMDGTHKLLVIPALTAMDGTHKLLVIHSDPTTLAHKLLVIYSDSTTLTICW